MAFLLTTCASTIGRELLKDILENAIPMTLQDVVLIFFTVIGGMDGRLVQISDARKIYQPARSAASPGAPSRSPPPPGVCAALDLHRAGRLPRAASSAGAGRSARLPANRFGRCYHVRTRAASPARARGMDRAPTTGDAMRSRSHGRSLRPPDSRRIAMAPHASIAAWQSLAWAATRRWSGQRTTRSAGAASPIDGAPLADVRASGCGRRAAAVGAAPAAFSAGARARRRAAASWSAGSASGCGSTRRDWRRWSRWRPARSSQEARGEVQEMIDICDFAVGLSRQLTASPSPASGRDHRMMEQWHPLGPVGVISAFNFPVAVWAWNAMLALVCGDTVVWKPSEKTPLCGHRLPRASLQRRGRVARAAARGHRARWSSARAGRRPGLVAPTPRLPLVSATGSVAMGRARGPDGGRAARAHAAGAGRQQRRDRGALGRSGAGPARRSSLPPSAPPASAARACAG